MSKTPEPPDRYEAMLEAERVRARARRAANSALKRPDPAAVDRAIVTALAEAWAQQVVDGSSPDLSAGERKALIQRPVSPTTVAEIAAANLVAKGFDPGFSQFAVTTKVFPTRERISVVRVGTARTWRETATPRHRVTSGTVSASSSDDVTGASEATGT